MQHLFQADISGALERIDRIENGHEQSNHRSSSDIILCSLKSTLKGFNPKEESVYLQAPGYRTEQQDPNDVCHAVLFKAWLQRKDALQDFSVSRYPRGVLPNEYYHVMESLNLTSYFKTCIYAMGPEVAMSALQELLPHIQTCRLYDYLPVYLRVYQGINSEQSYTQSVQQLLSTLLVIYTSNIQLATHHGGGLYQLVMYIHQSSQDIIKKHLLSSWKRLLKLINGNDTMDLSCANMDDVIKPDLLINMDDSRLWNNDTDSNMIDSWNKSSASPHRRHEYAFELICREIWKHAVPSRHATITFDQLLAPDGSNAKQQWSHASDLLSTHLTDNEWTTTDICLDLSSCMKLCMETLKNLSGSWKSITKAMTQFSDIWVRILPNNEYLKAFADLIVIGGTWTCLYRFVVNVLNLPCQDGYIELVNEQQKSSLCTLVRMVIEQLPTHILLELIYETYSDRSLPTDENTSLPFKCDLFNDMATLQKCCNQLVRTEQQTDMTSSSDPEVEPRLLHQLAMLAVLSPFQVVWRLVNHGIENKGQHDLVVSILRQLGDLCMLQRNSQDRTLMGHIIDSVLSNRHHHMRLDTLAPMLLSCWKYARNQSTCILLDSYDTILNNATIDRQIILQPSELFNSILLPALQQEDDYDSTLINDILGLLYTLTEDTSPNCEKWGQQLDQHVYYIPIILNMNIDLLMMALSEIMDKRYFTTTKNDEHTTDTPLVLSMALDIGRKLTMAIQHVCTLFKNRDDEMLEIKTRLEQFYCIDYYDWRTRLFWQESKRYVMNSDSTYLHVPSEVIAPFTKETDINDQQWILMLSGCRTSTLFTDEIFKNNYHLGSIWKHPYECNLFHQYLVHNLHPYFTTAAYYEYRLLLIYFLGRLYDTHENGGDDMIRHYQNYDPTVIPLVKLLTTEHCRIFFMILHCLLLLKTPGCFIKTTDDGTMIENGELYYVSGIIQTIQGMTNWQQLNDHTTQTLTRKQISTMTLYPENRMESSNTTTMDTTTTKQDIIDCYYPWMHNEQRRSGRALCLLVIQVICHISNSIRLRKSYDLLRVLLLQMLEILEDRQERNTFMDHINNKQTKSLINKWKKNKKDRRIRVHLRPTLQSCHEMDLISHCYTHLPSTDDQLILQNLLSSSSSSSPILYIYNSHLDHSLSHHH